MFLRISVKIEKKYFFACMLAIPIPIPFGDRDGDREGTAEAEIFKYSFSIKKYIKHFSKFEINENKKNSFY